jgi:hypothetical protein
LGIWAILFCPWHGHCFLFQQNQRAIAFGKLNSLSFGINNMLRNQAIILGILLTGVAVVVPSGGDAQADVLQGANEFATQHHHLKIASPHWGNQNMQQRHPLRMQQLFVVTERNPATGEIVSSPRRFSSRLEATQYRESLRSAAWVVWRYVGIGEPLRSLRFPNRIDAEQFVRTGGPARRGVLGALLLTHETRILPTRVSLETEHVR